MAIPTLRRGSRTPASLPPTAHRPAPASSAPGDLVGPAEVRFWQAFGFLHLPGLLAGDVARIDAAFEAAFADPAVERWSTDDGTSPLAQCRALHHDEPRTSIPQALDQPHLTWLADDPRVDEVVARLVGTVDRISSEATVMSCPTSWHIDLWKAPVDQQHLKAFIYLDPLDHDTGALRVLPGSHLIGHDANPFLQLTFAPERTPELFGMDPSELPSVAIPSAPGDVILLDYRTFHASFGGGPRRRFVAIDYRGRPAA